MINLAYLGAAVLFILGLKGLAHPRTATRGNRMGALGMLIAVIATLFDRQILSFEWIIAGLIGGALIGLILATRVQMTAMPQMVALLNGFGGAASVLVAGAALLEAIHATVNNQPSPLNSQFLIAASLSGIIGSVTFWGSLVAFGKLQGIVKDLPLRLTFLPYVNGALLLGALVLCGLLSANPTTPLYFWLLVACASVLGLFLVTPIGGADMPVVIALLNSYSGLAGAMTGFVLNNSALIITGSLVGASGIILTMIMCRAMNRSLTNVLFGVWVPTEKGLSESEVYGGRVKSSSADEIAMLLETAQRVVIVPGYGMAVSQAQHAVRDLARVLEARGAEVLFAIHPVAGRMPGHMNVLLAEADIEYEKMQEMEMINPSFEQTDVVIVIGANDVVNPLARTDPNSPIAGMPILDVDKARSVVIIKRSLSPGFAGIPNPLFAAENAVMFYADAKQGVQDIVGALKAG